MNIYLDTLVIVNSYITWLTLGLTSAITHIPSSPKRRAAAAFLGGFSALIVILPSVKGVLSLIVLSLRVLSFLAISSVAYLRKGMGAARFLAVCAGFFGVNIMFGGGVYLARNILGSDIIYINNTGYYFDISLGALIFFTALIYVISVLISRLVDIRAGKNRSYTVCFTQGGRKFRYNGISDTGNTVTDVFTGKPVIICAGSDEAPPSERIFAVPYSTIDGEGILYAFSPDELYIEEENGQKSNVQAKALVAFSEKGDRRAVFNPSLLQ